MPTNFTELMIFRGLWRAAFCLCIWVECEASLFAGPRQLNVYTYNVGLTKVGGVSLVPNVDARIPLQIYSLNQVVERPFVLFLQEVFTSRAWKAYRQWAEQKGYWIVKRKRRDNGLVIV